jgi:hypothetical protein
MRLISTTLTTSTYPATSDLITINVDNTGYFESIQTLVTGTVNYTIQINLGMIVDDPSLQNTPTYGTVIPDPNGWVSPYAAITAATASQLVQGLYPHYFLRCVANSGTGSSTIVTKVIQQGIR